MNTRLILVIITLGLKLTYSFGQSTGDSVAKQPQLVHRTQFDTSIIAMIPFDSKSTSPFDNNCRQATLTSDDFKDLDSLLSSCITNHNNSLEEIRKDQKIDLINTTYYKQLIPVINKEGEKEVWVNCFCNTWNSDRWKTKIMIVDDGGNCYFRLKINLTSKKCYELIVNGFA